MALSLKHIHILPSQSALKDLPEGKLLINTINAHSYNVAQTDDLFAEALTCGDVLIPDGASIVKACRLLHADSQPKERCAGWDLFAYEMMRLAMLAKASNTRKKVMFLGSSERVLELIRERAATEFPALEIITYSPPYKAEFSNEENQAMIDAVNSANPDLLWIGMTAPKQEKWTYSHWQQLHIHCHCGTIGAVFDFYACTMQRAPMWWQQHSLEWLYRLLKEPRRMWRRYIIGNAKFIMYIIKEKMHHSC